MEKWRESICIGKKSKKQTLSKVNVLKIYQNNGSSHLYSFSLLHQGCLYANLLIIFIAFLFTQLEQTWDIWADHLNNLKEFDNSINPLKNYRKFPLLVTSILTDTLYPRQDGWIQEWSEWIIYSMCQNKIGAPVWNLESSDDHNAWHIHGLQKPTGWEVERRYMW